MTSLPAAILLALLATVVRSAGDIINYHVVENSPHGTLVGDLMADADLSPARKSGLSDHLQFSFSSATSSSVRRHFDLERSTGRLTTKSVVDREALCPDNEYPDCLLRLEVVVRPDRVFRLLRIVVTVVDVNDNPPTFPTAEHRLAVSESIAVGSSFPLPVADDADAGDNGRVEYRLLPSADDDENENFRLDAGQSIDGSTDLRLVVASPLDREAVSEYLLRLLAYDAGNPALSATMMIALTVIDTNDNKPRFSQLNYSVDVVENIDTGTVIGVVHAEDLDDGDNGRITYSFARNTQASFGINESTGELFVSGVVDHELRQTYRLIVVASDGVDSSDVRLSSHAVVNIRVTDLNDNPPNIVVNSLSPSGFAEVSENEPVGSFVAHMTVGDLDPATVQGQIECHLEPGNDDAQRQQQRAFSLHRYGLNADEFRLTNNIVLDRESRDRYRVIVTCTDAGQPRLTGQQVIEVVVTDLNDVTPSFDQQSYVATLAENNRPGEFIVQVHATDDDVGPSGQLTYSISGSDGLWTHLVGIDPASGRITADVAFDRESRDSFEFVVEAKDAGTPRARSSSVVVRVEIADVDDELPAFPVPSYTFGTYENQPAGTEVGTVAAVDRDSSPFNAVVYGLIDDDAATASTPSNGTFQIDAQTGRITSTIPLDRETTPVYHLIVVASPMLPRGGAAEVAPAGNGSSIARVKIVVADRNDNAPVFAFPSVDNDTAFVTRGTRAHGVVTRVVANDRDIAANAALRFSLTADGDGDDDGRRPEQIFDVNPLNGIVTVNRELGLNDVGEFRLRVDVRDAGNPPLRSSARLVVVVNITSAAGAAAAEAHETSGPFAASGPDFNILAIVVMAVVAASLLVVCILAASLVLHRIARRMSPGDRRRATEDDEDTWRTDEKLKTATKRNFDRKEIAFDSEPDKTRNGLSRAKPKNNNVDGGGGGGGKTNCRKADRKLVASSPSSSDSRERDVIANTWSAVNKADHHTCNDDHCAMTWSTVPGLARGFRYPAMRDVNMMPNYHGNTVALHDGTMFTCRFAPVLADDAIGCGGDAHDSDCPVACLTVGADGSDQSSLTDSGRGRSEDSEQMMSFPLPAPPRFINDASLDIWPEPPSPSVYPSSCQSRSGRRLIPLSMYSQWDDELPDPPADHVMSDDATTTSGSYVFDPNGTVPTCGCSK